MSKIRNFWIKAQIDGRQTELASGPADDNGGFTAQVYICHNGESVQALRIYAAEEDGKLKIFGYPMNDQKLTVVSDPETGGFTIEAQR